MPEQVVDVHGHDAALGPAHLETELGQAAAQTLGQGQYGLTPPVLFPGDLGCGQSRPQGGGDVGGGEQDGPAVQPQVLDHLRPGRR